MVRLSTKIMIRTTLAAMALVIAGWGCTGGKTTTAKSTAAPMETVTIGGKMWTKRNLNVETAGSWCYENNPDSCAKYGRLYTWEAARGVCAALGSEWRLPDTADWNALVDAAGEQSVAGTKLKTPTGWKEHSVVPAGTDEYGFSALPGGYLDQDGKFGYAGVNGAWWSADSADEYNANDAHCRFIYYYNEYVTPLGCNKNGAYAVRCIRDE